MRKLHKQHFQLVHFWALAGERWGCEGPRRRAEEAGCPHRVLQQEGGRASKAARTSVCQVRQHNEGMVWPKFSHFFQVWRRFHWCWEQLIKVGRTVWENFSWQKKWFTAGVESWDGIDMLTEMTDLSCTEILVSFQGNISNKSLFWYSQIDDGISATLTIPRLSVGMLEVPWVDRQLNRD